MSQISKCPKITVVLSYWEALGEVSELSYKSLLYSTSVGSYCISFISYNCCTLYVEKCTRNFTTVFLPPTFLHTFISHIAIEGLLLLEGGPHLFLLLKSTLSFNLMLKMWLKSLQQYSSHFVWVTLLLIVLPIYVLLCIILIDWRKISVVEFMTC